MKIFAALALSTLMFAGACTDDGNNADNFVGSYKNTLTVSGTGSQTITDSVSVSEGATSDLIINSQTLGAIKATVIGKTSFSLDQQQITLSVNGQAVSVTVQGQGTIADGVFNASGMLSSNTGALSFTWAGSRL